ncbi:MAG TPA: 1-acyl-sn-glycerol-3-phosphate acyltransferase, partial [Verrucomicrobiales bacterium]|nr:1-acyl-sn-glycerol-3-phosphate acyltransferase [Verrucomicrobiales bacterium]
RLVTGVRLLHAAPHGAGPAIYFANHASHLDFVVVWAALPAEARELASPAAAEDYWGRTALRRKVACGIFQSVLIPREGITRENNPLDRLGAVLEQGRSVIIFPEGTRRQDGEVGEFKAGLYHLAKRFPNIPLVPVHLDNLSRILPKGSLLIVPLIAQAHFRAPIHWREGEPKPDFLRRARAALLDESQPES